MFEATAPAHANRRPHIQGVRAVAVLLVIAGHAFDWPAGGFLGVDVFFVVSGFVITLSLLREIERDGTVSLRAFVIRRLGRLFPAAALVAAATVAAGFALFFLPRALSIAFDGGAAVLSLANWRAARLGTDYFGGFAQASPLQHYWSLAVEEQFYAVWPLVCALCALAGWPRMRRWAGWIAGGATIVSFAIALLESSQRPAWAYFSFESRAWELGVGVTLAILLARTAVRPVASRTLALAGAVALSAGVVFVDGTTGFPAPWALPVVLGTAALIAAGETTAPARILAPLRIRPLTFLGDISYSLYLWHFPLLIFAVALAPGVGAWLSLAVLLPVAYATYRWVEMPLRDRASARASRGAPGMHLAWGVTAFVVIGTLSATQIAGPKWLIDTPAPAAPATAGVPFASTEQLGRDLAAALDHPEAPAGVLDAAWAAASAAQFAAARGCLRSPAAFLADPQAAATACTFPADTDAPTLVVFGDSVAVSWLPGIVAAAAGRWRVVGLGIQSCPPGAVSVPDRSGRAEFAAECDAARTAALEVIADLNPRLVVLGSALGSFDRLTQSSGSVAAASGLWRDGTRDTLARLGERTDSRVVLLSSPPESAPVLACATRLTGTAACESTPSAGWVAKTDAETAAASSASATAVDTLPWFCVDGRCPAVASDTLVLADGGHLTTAYAQRLARLLDDAMGLDEAPTE